MRIKLNMAKPQQPRKTMNGSDKWRLGIFSEGLEHAGGEMNSWRTGTVYSQMQKTWQSVAQGGGVEMKIEAGGLLRLTQRSFKLPQPGLILRLYSYWPAEEAYHITGILVSGGVEATSLRSCRQV